MSDKITQSFLRRPTYASSATTSNATGVDVSQFTGLIKFQQDVGAIGGTTPTFDGKLQHSDDNTSFTDISGAAFTQVTASNANQTIHLDSRALKKYVRHVMTTGGTMPTGPYAVAMTGEKQQQS